jgi:hypothetical protein
VGGLRVTPENVRAGADRIGAENASVTCIAVPDATAAAAGLPGFATAGVLVAAHDGVVSSLKAVGGRYQQMQHLCKQAADTYALADLIAPGLLPPTWLSQQVGDGMTGLGDLNTARG